MKHSNPDFADRLSAAADAKKAQLERAARAKAASESDGAMERRKLREATSTAREGRITERKTIKQANEARLAGELAAGQAAEAVAREVALKAEEGLSASSEKAGCSVKVVASPCNQILP